MESTIAKQIKASAVCLQETQNLINKSHNMRYGEITLVKCPRCGTHIPAPTKEWDYSVFRVKRYDCNKCNKGFMAYLRDGKLSHTIPKRK